MREPVRRSERVRTATALQIHPPQVANDIHHIDAIDLAVTVQIEKPGRRGDACEPDDGKFGVVIARGPQEPAVFGVSYQKPAA